MDVSVEEPKFLRHALQGVHAVERSVQQCSIEEYTIRLTRSGSRFWMAELTSANYESSTRYRKICNDKFDANLRAQRTLPQHLIQRTLRQIIALAASLISRRYAKFALACKESELRGF